MPRILRKTGFTLLAPAAAVAVAIGGCKNYDVKYAPFNPRANQREERANAVGTPEYPKRALPTTLETEFPINPDTPEASTKPVPPPTTGPVLGSMETVVHMSMRELTQRCAANNLDAKVQGYQPAIDETRVIEREADFDPVFFTNVQYSVSNILGPSVNNISAPSNEVTTFREYGGQVGVRQQLESGGKVELRAEPSWTKRAPGDTSGFGTSPIDPNPFWQSDLTLQITQPLLQNFGGEVNRARIVINRNNQRISLLDFRDTLEKNVSDLEKNYWQLVQAVRDVHIAEDLLNRTLETTKILHQRIKQDVGRQQLSQAVSSLELRRTLLIRARAHVRDLSDQIKQLMNDPEFPVSGQTLILPADKVLGEQIRTNLEDEINTAMESRLELGQQQLRVANAGVAADVAKNNLLPKLDFVGSVGPRGIGGNPLEAFEDEMGWDHLDFTVGFQFEVPIGNRAARAVRRRAQLQRMQAIDQYRSLIDQITFDVKTKARDVNTTWEERVGSGRAVFASLDALAAIEERERANEALTPEFVNRKLDLQSQLAQAQTRESEADANYMIALSALEKAKGTLLRYNNIVMEESPLEASASAR